MPHDICIFIFGGMIALCFMMDKTNRWVVGGGQSPNCMDIRTQLPLGPSAPKTPFGMWLDSVTTLSINLLEHLHGTLIKCQVHSDNVKPLCVSKYV